MPNVDEPQPAVPQLAQSPGADPVLVLLVVLVVVLLLGFVGYVCMAHPSLTGPIAAVGGVAGALATVFAVVVALRKR
ncbi:hypothetical protein [Streptomyces lavendulae]|uniref:hypothetical protein n=1 Tax=Streptomyces lavendulae TaxID=1914 RepID=UPI0036E3E2C2